MNVITVSTSRGNVTINLEVQVSASELDYIINGLEMARDKYDVGCYHQFDTTLNFLDRVRAELRAVQKNLD